MLHILARIGLQAGFVELSTLNNIQKRGELDLTIDNVNPIKYLPTGTPVVISIFIDIYDVWI